MIDLMNRDYAHLFIASREAIYGVQLDRGEAQIVPWALYGSFVRCLFVDEKGVLIAAGLRGGGVHSTADGGKTWRGAAGLDSGDVRVLAGRGPSLVAGTADGRILRSADGGASFSEVQVPSVLRDKWKGLGDGGPRVAALVVGDDRIVAGIASGGVVAAKGGSEWTALGDGLPAGVLSLASSADDLVAGTTDGLYRLKSNEGTWQRMFVPRQRFAVTAVAFDPGNADVILCGASRALDVAKPALPEGADAAVFRSADGGKTFDTVRLGIPVVRGVVTRIVHVPAKPGTVFLSTSAGELFDSEDGGLSFRLCAATLPGVLDLMLGDASHGGS